MHGRVLFTAEPYLQITQVFALHEQVSITLNHYAPASVPLWCFQSTTTLVHQLTVVGKSF